MNVFIVAILLLMIYVDGQSSPGCGSPSAGVPGSTITYQIPYGADVRTFIVHKSTQYDDNTARPVIFGFPGYTISASYFSTNFAMNPHSDQENYLAVYVQATSFESGGAVISWNDIGCSSSPGPEGCSGAACNQPTCVAGNWVYPIPPDCPQDNCNWCNCNADDIGFINFLANEILLEYCVDLDRVFALGYSQGGMMTQRMGCQSNNMFSAIAPFAGQQPVGFNCGPQLPFPIGLINVWGTNDNVVPGNGGVSSDGWLYSNVSAVQAVFAQHNECSGNPVPVSSESDGTQGWTCTGYTSCGDNNIGVRECNYNGGHQYPKFNPNNPNSANFALPVVWTYFNDFVDGLSVNAKMKRRQAQNMTGYGNVTHVIKHAKAINY